MAAIMKRWSDTAYRRRLRLGALALIGACLPVAGCGDDDAAPGSTRHHLDRTAPARLTVAVEPDQAAPGDTVEASVVNDTDETFTYGAAYELEVRSGEDWEAVEIPVRPVPEIGYVAPPGEAGPPVAVELPKDLAAGTYRVVIQRGCARRRGSEW